MRQNGNLGHTGLLEIRPVRKDVRAGGISQAEVSRWMRADFNEMPDLRVTAEQAARFWGIDPGVSRAALVAMVEAGFLVCRGKVYRRATT